MSRAGPNTKSYVVGFALSVILTLLAFAFVVFGGETYWLIVLAILSLAVVQLFVQLYFFLHLNDEGRPRIKLQTFISAAVVVIVVVFGSLWIMDNTSKYHGHNALKEDIGEYIQDEEAIHKEPARDH